MVTTLTNCSRKKKTVQEIVTISRLFGWGVRPLKPKGLELVKRYKMVNRNKRLTGTPFQKFLFFRKCSTWLNKKVAFHLQFSRNFRKFFVNREKNACQYNHKETPTMSCQGFRIWENFLDISMLGNFGIFCGTDVLKEKRKALVSASKNPRITRKPNLTVLKREFLSC